MVKGLLYVYTVGDGFTYTVSFDADIYLVTSPKGNMTFFRDEMTIAQVKKELSNKFPGAVFTYVARDIKAKQK